MMKRALMNPMLKFKDPKISENDIARFLAHDEQTLPQQFCFEELGQDYDLSVVDKRANDLLDLKIYDNAYKTIALCSVIVRNKMHTF
jgi:hypothetical protein